MVTQYACNKPASWPFNVKPGVAKKGLLSQSLEWYKHCVLCVVLVTHREFLLIPNLWIKWVITGFSLCFLCEFPNLGKWYQTHSWDRNIPSFSVLWEFIAPIFYQTWEFDVPVFSVTWVLNVPLISLAWVFNVPINSLSWDFNVPTISLTWGFNVPSFSLTWEIKGP